MNEEDFKTLCGLILSLMICFGFIGNSISFITWRRGQRCKTLPGSVYLSVLAVSDNLILITSGAKYVIELLFTINLWNLGEVACKVFHTTWHLFFLESTWLVVCLTLERTIAVCQPLKRTLRQSKKRETIVAIVLFAVFLLFNLPFTFGATMRVGSIIQDKNERTVGMNETIVSLMNTTVNETASTRMMMEKTCQADPESFYFKYENQYHNWVIDFGLLFSAPVLILTVCNATILVTLCRRNTALVGIESHQHVKTPNSFSGPMTARVMALSLVQCISVGPFSVAALIPGVLPDTQAVDTIQFINKMFIIFALIWYLNNCVNYILYSLFGKVFREDCIQVICGQGRRRAIKNSQLSPAGFFSNGAYSVTTDNESYNSTTHL